VNRIYDALPMESRTGRVQLLMPAAGLGATQLQAGSEPLFSKHHTPAAVLHLAATGDHGFSRRLRLGAPLLQQVRMCAFSPTDHAMVWFRLAYQVTTNLDCCAAVLHLQNLDLLCGSQHLQTASPGC
jgi:hypothetical protein